VTHDQEEALSMSDRIVVMHGGIAEQVGTPFEVYNRPATKFVANFVGMLNTLSAEVIDAATGRVRIGGTEATLRRPLPEGKVMLAARPEMISLGLQPGRDTVLDGTITSVDFLGSVIRLRARVDGSDLAFDMFNTTEEPPPAPGTDVRLSLLASDLLLIGEN
jgi:putative spermidine/putrescine transport system ATP-binding protein